MDGLTHPGCKKRYTIDGVFASIAYKSLVKKLLYKYKYPPYLSDLTSLLGELLYEGIIQNEIVYQIFTRQPVLIPIPLHPSKLRTRGYNQAELLTKTLSQKTGLVVVAGLVRTKKTPSQTTLARADRLENVKDIFALPHKQGSLIKGKEVVLIDDVFTTGATFYEAAKVLKPAGVEKVWGIALAHEE